MYEISYELIEVACSSIRDLGHSIVAITDTPVPYNFDGDPYHIVFLRDRHPDMLEIM